MTPAQAKNREAQRQALLGQLNAAGAALRANLDLNCANVTARMHMQRALVHIQEAEAAVNGARRVRTVWQLVEDLTKSTRDLDELRSEPPARCVVRPTH